MESSPESEGSEAVRKEPRKGPPECEICYRPAHGHHCGVASCKGCKTFFRRMCISNSELECKINGDCFDQSKKNEIYFRCQACRYKKCIEVGMNPNALELKGDEKNSLNFKNQMKRSNNNVEKNENDQLKLQILNSKQTQVKNLINMLTHLDSEVEKFRMSAFNPTFFEYGSLEDMLGLSNRIGLADKFGPMQGWPLPMNQIPKRLSLKSKIRDVPDIAATFKPEMQVLNKTWLLFNLLTAIEYAKTFPFFHQIDLRDRLVLLSHVSLTCMNLSSTYFAIARKIDGCLQPDGSETPQKDEFNYPTFSMSFGPLIRCSVDRTEYVLLNAICLCNPTVHGLTEHAQSIIVKERQKYADALLDYCFRKNGNGPSRFTELLGIIPTLEKQQQIQKHIHIYHIAPIIAKYDLVIQFLEDVMYS